MNATFNKHFNTLCLALTALLLSGCGADAYYQPFAVTEADWKFFDALDTESGTTEWHHTLIDDDGNTWQCFLDKAEGHRLRKVNRNGVEHWRLALDSKPAFMALDSTGIVMTSDNGTTTAVSNDGNIRWQHNPLPSQSGMRALATAADGRILLGSATLAVPPQIQFTLLDTNGSTVREYSFAAPGLGFNTIKLLAHDNGESILIYHLNYDDTDQVALDMLRFDSAGNLVASHQPLSNPPSMLQDAQLQNGRINLVGNNRIFQIDGDGNLLWQYPGEDSYSANLQCAATGELEMACVNDSSGAGMTIDWLDSNGQLANQRSYDLDHALSLSSDNNGRLLLAESRYPSLDLSQHYNLLHSMGLTTKKYNTQRLHVLGSRGEPLQTVNLQTAQMVPMLMLNLTQYAVTYGGDFEYINSARLVGSQLIASATLRDITAESSVKIRSFVSAFSVP